MKYKKNNFELRNICGEFALIAQGVEHVDFGKMIALNETAAFIWEHLPEEPFEVNPIAELLLAEYEDVDLVTATADVEELFRLWVDGGVLTAC